ncbi:MAG: cyclic nucleotide-binding domain-containing protein [Desulfovibrio sp.]|nr:MAG: cyclic nucleotide-binding domain-containing protein [Desulfovibrio sp.]
MADNISELLRTTRWGEQFAPSDLDVIAKFMSVRTFDDGQSIFEQGDKEAFLAFIVEGSVDIAKEVTESLEKIVVTLRAKTHFGELSFVDAQPRSASAIARGDVTILVFSRAGFDSLVKEDPDLGIKIQQTLLLSISRRLRMTTRELIYRD